jgi:hypothetical protein
MGSLGSVASKTRPQTTIHYTMYILQFPIKEATELKEIHSFNKIIINLQRVSINLENLLKKCSVSCFHNFVYRYTFVSIEKVKADRQLCAPKTSMLIPAIARTDFIEEVEADRQLCAPKISILIPTLARTDFIEEVEADRSRQLCAPKISMLIPALAITDFIEEVNAD